MIGIDLGSNTFRAVELSCENLEVTGRYEKIVRTADGMVETGRISPDAVERVVEAAREASKVLDFSQPVVAVTTEAIRRAENGEEVLEEIRRRTGLSFRIVSGEEEAQLTLLAVRIRLQKLGLEHEDFVMVDIGGGSTEVVFVAKDTVTVRSFPVGIVTMAQRYGTLRRIEAALAERMKPVEAFVKEAKERGMRPKLFVSTAGTPTTVAAMKRGMDYASYDGSKINGTSLVREDLRVQLQRLLSLDVEERRRLVGVGREDLIAAGIMIFDRLYEILGFEEAVVIDDGLREGAAIFECLRQRGSEIRKGDN
ncbi:phosphatase [Hydrogenimonas sp.]|uniref:Ppx/GppA phosphatase family protein n=1 Tax=Hydrogenimonas sp. TaxID=2231112 RepID=UPI002617F957|nr:phosphatase [Hydrogenimonas sp.]